MVVESFEHLYKFDLSIHISGSNTDDLTGVDVLLGYEWKFIEVRLDDSRPPTRRPMKLPVVRKC